MPRAHLRQRAEEAPAPALQDQDAVGQGLDQLELMRGDPPGRAAERERADRLARRADPARVEARERLVEQHQARRGQPRLRAGELLAHAARELAAERAALLVELEAREQL